MRCFILSLVALSCLIASDSRCDEFRKITSDKHVYTWAYDQSSGRLFGSSVLTNEVLEFSTTSGEAIATISVGQQPSEMMVKARRLLVLCDESVYVIDLDSNKVDGTIELGRKASGAPFASNADNTYAYIFVVAQERSYLGFDLVQFDFANHRISKTFSDEAIASKQADFSDFQSQPIGTRILGSGYDSENVFVELDEEKGVLNRYCQTNAMPMDPGPASRFWLSGNSVRSASRDNTFRQFDSNTAVLHSKLDLAASVVQSGGREDRKTFLQFDTFSTAQRIELVELEEFQIDTSVITEGELSTQYVWKRPILVFDEARSQVVCARGNSAFVVDSKPYEEKCLPLLLLHGPTQVQGQVNSDVSIPFRLTNEELTDQTVFELQGNPAGMKITGQTITWHPKMDDVGGKTIRLIAKHQNRTDSLSIDLSVSAPHLDIGIQAEGFAISPGGRFAAIWGGDGESTFDGFQRRIDTQESQLVVVDLAERKLVGSRKLDKPVQKAWIDDSHVYYAPRTGNLLMRAPIADLGEQQRSFLPGGLTQMRIDSDGSLLLMVYGNRGTQQLVYDRETFRQLADDPRNVEPEQMQRLVESRLLPVSGGLAQLGHRMVDANTGETICIIRQPDIPNITPDIHARNLIDRRDLQIGFDDRFNTAKSWGRRILGGEIFDSRGSRISYMESNVVTVSVDHPFAAAIVQNEENVNLVFHELVQGNRIESVQLAETDFDQFHFHDSTGRQFVTCVGDHVAVLLGTKVLFVDVPKECQSVDSPLHFQYPAIKPIDLSESATFNFEVSGGVGEKRFQMMVDVPHVELDSETGQVNVDGPAIWRQHLSTIVERIKKSSKRSRIRDLGKIREGYQGLVDADKFRHLSGSEMPPNSEGFVLPVPVEVYDEEGQQDSITLWVPVFGSRQVKDSLFASVRAGGEPAIPPLTSEAITELNTTPALRFRDKQFVEITNSVSMLDINGSFTAECWVRLRNPKTNQYFFGDEVWPSMSPHIKVAGQCGWVLRGLPNDDGQLAINFTAGNGSRWVRIDAVSVPADLYWHHVAVSKDGSTVRIFFDGKKIGEGSVVNLVTSPTNLFIGPRRHCHDDRAFNADIRAARISSTARYDKVFQPEEELENDESSLVLLDVENANVSRVSNLASDERVGIVSGPLRIGAPATSKETAPVVDPNASAAMRFAGRQHIEIQKSVGLVDVNGSFTAECWFKLNDHTRAQYFIGNEAWPDMSPFLSVSGNVGWILRCNPQPDGQLKFNFNIGSGDKWNGVDGALVQGDSHWHHLAVAKDQQTVRIFLDGKKIGEGNVPSSLEDCPTNLYIGPRLHGHPNAFLDADLRNVRVSNTNRYPDDFTPAPAMSADDTTLVLLDFDRAPNNRIENLAARKELTGKLSGPVRVGEAANAAAQAADFDGTWEFKYTNNLDRTYIIKGDQLTWVQDGSTFTITIDGNQGLMPMRSNSLERITVVGDFAYLERYDDGSKLSTGDPIHMALGTRIKK